MFQSQSGLCTSKTLWPDKNATLYYSFQIVLHLHVMYNYVPSKVKNKSLTTVLSYSTVYINISQFKEKNSLLPVSNPACKWSLWKIYHILYHRILIPRIHAVVQDFKTTLQKVMSCQERGSNSDFSVESQHSYRQQPNDVFSSLKAET